MPVVGAREGDRTVGEFVDGIRADVARRLTKAHEATARREGIERGLERVLADGVVDDLNAAPIRQPLHGSRDIFARRNDYVIASDAPGLLRLGVA